MTKGESIGAKIRRFREDRDLSAAEVAILENLLNCPRVASADRLAVSAPRGQFVFSREVHGPHQEVEAE